MRVIPLFWLLFPLGLPAKELVICGTMEPPLKYLDADQKPRGLDIDIVTTIFDKLETPFGSSWPTPVPASPAMPKPAPATW